MLNQPPEVCDVRPADGVSATDRQPLAKVSQRLPAFLRPETAASSGPGEMGIAVDDFTAVVMSNPIFYKTEQADQ